jgi:SAM-dependent methyltransferase
VPSDRQLIYSDKRANPEGKMPDDVWTEYPRVCGTFKERAGWHPCQMPENLLKRIIAVSSNRRDCVLDPFSGSGTTAAAAYQLARNYVAIEISQEYVEKTRKRLAEFKMRGGRNQFLDFTELGELKRLLCDTEIPPKEIVADKNLLNLFANQFAVRMNNSKRYETEEIATALRDLAD